MPKLSIIVPVFNEEQTIEKAIEKLNGLNLDKEIIVIDDGSIDKTREKIERLAGKINILIRHEKNQGKGAALRSGIARASGEYIIFCDADLEYDIEQIPVLLARIRENNLVAVYGSRFLNYSPAKNRLHYLGNRFLTRLTNVLFGARLSDMETGYKIFRREILLSLSLKSAGFEIEPEITAKLLKRKIKISEIPVSYDPRGKAEGKKIKYRDGWKALKMLVKERFFSRD